MLGQTQLFRRQDLAGDHPEDGAGALPVNERIGAESRQAGNLVGEVGVVPLGEFLAVAVGHDRPEQRLDGLGASARDRPGSQVERLHPAVLADGRRRADAEMQIGRLGGAHRMKQPINRCR